MILVSVVWAGNFVASVFVTGYASDSALNFVFMTIVGAALALRSDGQGGAGSLIARLGSTIRPPAPPPPPPPPEQEQ